MTPVSAGPGRSLSLGVIAPYVDGIITSKGLLGEFLGIMEECGAESLWTVEHVIEAEAYERLYPYAASGKMPGRLVPMADPLELLAFASAVTSTLTLGTSVVIAPLHSPAVLAKRAATIDRLSDGRLLLGLGIGWQKEEYGAVGVPFADRGTRLEESIGAMRALWADVPATYSGRYVSFQRVHSLPRPSRSTVPIVLGGNSPPAVRRCARLGDGWFPHAITPAEFAAAADLLRSTAEAAGRSMADIPITVAPGSTDPRREMDPDWVRPYVEHGATRLVITAGDLRAGGVGALRERILRYREQIIDRFSAISG